ncbi:MAG: 16S rRNA (adenine(1518)-N(6)/adenine(1519)-N(6))-dimethyltransferase RsmA [Mycobacteriales bacterium]
MSDGLLGPTDLRRIAAGINLRPTKSLGQNFVHDANTVRRIVSAAQLDPRDVVLEVGPGLGSLTLGLVAAAARVVAVEVDPQLSASLRSTVDLRLPEFADRLEVITADALALSSVAGPPPTAMVANLPYNVAVPVVLHLLDVVPSLRRILVMVQAEVAQRMAAPPGSRVYGVPSVKAAWYADVRRAGAVSRHVFWPEPNVDSELVLLTRRAVPEGAPREVVFRVIDKAFSQRRKTLRSGLAGLAGSPAVAEEVLRAAGVDPGARGEAIDVHDFTRVAAELARRGLAGAPT